MTPVEYWEKRRRYLIAEYGEDVGERRYLEELQNDDTLEDIGSVESSPKTERKRPRGRKGE